jgi:hypothetical protein
MPKQPAFPSLREAMKFALNNSHAIDFTLKQGSFSRL